MVCVRHSLWKCRSSRLAARVAECVGVAPLHPAGYGVTMYHRKCDLACWHGVMTADLGFTVLLWQLCMCVDVLCAAVVSRCRCKGCVLCLYVFMPMQYGQPSRAGQGCKCVRRVTCVCLEHLLRLVQGRYV